jgi:hypothetical protein
MLITKSIFQSFLECETKSFLKFSKVAEVQSEFGTWQQYLTEGFKQKCSLHLRIGLSEHECLVGVLPTKGTEDKCRLVLDCSIRAQEMQSCIDALERPANAGKTKHHPYVPVRFVPNEKITSKGDYLLDAGSVVFLSQQLKIAGNFSRLPDRCVK